MVDGEVRDGKRWLRRMKAGTGSVKGGWRECEWRVNKGSKRPTLTMAASLEAFLRAAANCCSFSCTARACSWGGGALNTSMRVRGYRQG